MKPWLAAAATVCAPIFLLLLGGFFLSSDRDAHMPHHPGEPGPRIWPSLLIWFFAPAGLALGYMLAGDSAGGLRVALGGYVLLAIVTIIVLKTPAQFEEDGALVPLLYVVLVIAAMVYAGFCGFGAFKAAEISFRP